MTTFNQADFNANVTQMQTKLKEVMSSLQEDTEATVKIAKVLKKFDGKIIGKRMENALKVAGFVTKITKYYGAQLEIWGKGIEYSNRLVFKLTPDSKDPKNVGNNTYDHGWFMETNAQLFKGAKERNNARSEFLKDEQKTTALATALVAQMQAEEIAKQLAGDILSGDIVSKLLKT